jgi:2-keto-4-pentenoate hydratase/2-oxohepta-3-ene-1,7-dioic acid hydratase in catechol pathway
LRWVRYLSGDAVPAGGGDPMLGIVRGDAILGGLAGSLAGLLTRAELGVTGRGLAREPAEVVPLERARLLAPIPDPPSVRDFMAFEQHVEGMGRLAGAEPPVPDVWYRQPLFYFSNPTAVAGPYDDVAIPPGCAVFDFELEVAAVIGPLPERQELSDLSLAEAARAIAGYVLMNDWSARDLQAVEMQGPLGPCKGKDSAITLGPWFVTADELPGLAEGHSETLLSATVNGEPFGPASLGSMAWTFAELAAYAARGTRLRPGDLLGSGTCGDGCLAERWGRSGRDAAPPLRPGDVVALDGGILGRTANRVAAGRPVRQPLQPRPRSPRQDGA